MSSNQKDSYWEVGSLGDVRSFGLALTDSGGTVTGGGGDRKANVLQRVRPLSASRVTGRTTV